MGKNKPALFMNTDCRYLIAKILLLIFYAVSFSASLVALISAAVDFKHYPCDNGFLSLKIWQIIYGSIRIPIFVILVLSYECFRMEKNAATSTPTIPRILFVTFIFAIFFDVIWSIIGSVNLFAFSPSCQSDEFKLWIISLYCLVVEYVSIIAFCCHFFWYLTHT